MKFGIIGGLGAFASSRLYELINTEAVNQAKGEIIDSIFPELVIHQVPFAATDALGNANDILFRQEVNRSLDLMELACVDVVVFACNTLDYIMKELIEPRNLSYISVTDHTIESVNKNRDIRSIAVMTSEKARFAGLYRNQILAPVLECEQEKVNTLIQASMSGKAKEFAYLFKDVEKSFSKTREGCIIILGCTELSVYSPYASMDSIDGLQLISEEIIRMNNENSQ
jgi:aspartate/glutamate racemase